MKKSHLITFYFFIFSCSIVIGQSRNIYALRDFNRAEIPFEIENDFIVVNVMFNRLIPLKFIFDTGAEYSILTKREITDILQVNYNRVYTIMGADMKTELTAYLASNIELKLDRFVHRNRSILVLEDDYFQFEEFAGINVQGIIGADLFRQYIVEINYDKKVIILHNPREFKIKKNYSAIPIEINKGKPYLKVNTSFRSDSSANLKLLVDTGASLSLLLYPGTNGEIKLPEKFINTNIAMGMGGYIEGFLGRIQTIDIGPYQFKGVITNFQDLITNSELDTTFLNSRNGLLGNRLLYRFNIIIDYIKEVLYIKPNKDFKTKFRYDRSGIILAASGPNLTHFTVYHVVPGSPAAEAGVETGDEILGYGIWPISFFSMEGLTRKLQGKVGKKVRLHIKRDEEKFHVKFALRELI